MMPSIVRVVLAFALAETLAACAHSSGRLSDAELTAIAEQRYYELEGRPAGSQTLDVKLTDVVRVRLHPRPTGDVIVIIGGVDVYIDPVSGKVIDTFGRQ